MPFKLKLKKSRHYSVASKSLFVISVEILDGTTVECTLSSESTGQDCLDVVCQKLSLNQPKFFGLQYVSRNNDNNFSWLELDRPIKRQLDKYARGLNVYLRVMYYVISGVRLLNDEITRYYYFLQLKMDVIEGRISCTPQQSVELASYCMQAEFGNFDAERHTSNYLKDFQLFPKTDPALLESLTEAASRQHALLHNLPQGTAEEYYICACQKLDGYGQEIFSVKNRKNEDVLVGVSLTGVYVSYSDIKETKHYGWSNIQNVINHKRYFIIELIGGNENLEFQFPDVEGAKNAWRFSVLQHMFYREHEMNVINDDQTDRITMQLPVFQPAVNDDKFRIRSMDSCEDVAHSSSYQWDRLVSSTQSLSQRAQSTTCLDLKKPNDIERLRSLLPSYRPAPDYETAMQQKYRNSSSAIPANEPLRNTHHHHPHHGLLYSSQPEIHQSDTFTTLLRYPDVTHNNIEQKNLIQSVYNTNFQQQQQMLTKNNRLNNIDMFNLYKTPPPYPSNRISSNSTPDLAGISQQHKPQHHFINNIVSGSSPDLVSSGNFYLNLLQNHQPPPAHQPIHRSHSYLPPQHGTYENLASIFNNNMLGRPQAVIVENPNVTKHIKKVYDEHGNIIYCMPANMKQILQENQLPSTGFVVTRNQNAMVAHDTRLNSSTEPIYENIPLPWQNDGMRARTQSIHSAPEISHAVNHALKSQLQQLNLNNTHNNDSKENLYANIEQHSTKSSKTDLVGGGGMGSETNIINRSNQNLNKITVDNNVNGNESPLTMSRTNTFIVNKNTSGSSGTTTTTTTSFMDNSTTSGETFNDISSTSNASSTKSKKKRWGILIGRAKSSDKIKSATLGREKDKKDKNQSNNKHRWSTGLPRLNPLPPSISKETMVSCFVINYYQ